jgi:hypothetical protein
MKESGNAPRMLRATRITNIVMAGLDPAIPADAGASMDGRVTPGHDDTDIRL